jgi:hypothetical protein
VSNDMCNLIKWKVCGKDKGGSPGGMVPPMDNKKEIGYPRGNSWKELEKCFLMVPE